MDERCEDCGANMQAELAWCGRCLQPRKAQRRRPGVEIVMVLPDARAGTILEGGVASFGLAGKFIVSLLLTVGAICGVTWSQTWLDMGRPLQGLMVLLGIGYTALAAILLQWTWRPERRSGVNSETIVVVDAAIEAAVERRRKAMAERS
ncbi:MAG: hypothetical protein ABI828_03665 [Actinomycetota bacterium]